MKLPNMSTEKRYKQFVSNYVPKPLSPDINNTSGYRKLDLLIKEAFDDVWKLILDISDINMKYQFWLRNINESDEFREPYDVKEYLIGNVFHEKEKIERLQHELNDFHGHLSTKLINILHEVVKILERKKCTTDGPNNNNSGPREELKGMADVNFQTTIEGYKGEINTRIKTLEMENERLRKDESDYSAQIQILLGELALSKRKLEDIKECTASLTEEKTNLISSIQNTEAKKECLQSLQLKFEIEQEKNKHLRDIIAKAYEK